MSGTLIARKVRSLSDSVGMTRDEVSQITGSSPRTVARWVSGESLPQRVSRDRLLELVYVAEQLSRVMTKEAANLWLFSPNPMLDHQRPADRIKAGDFQSVLNLIEALADGVVF